MTKREYGQYRMLVRVRKFGVTHKEQFAEGSEGGKAFGVVADAVTQVDAFTKSKLTTKRVGKREKVAATRALAARIGAIARSARALAAAQPGADAKFPLPTKQTDVAVLQSGRLFVQEAEPVKDAFIRCGLPATFMEELQQAVVALEEAIDGRDSGKTGAVVSQQGIKAAVRKGVAAVRLLDVFVANTLGHDKSIIAAWKKDRHVVVAGKNGSSGEPSDQPESMPEPAAEEPTPPVTVTTPTLSSAAHPPDASAVEEPLRRAS